MIPTIEGKDFLTDLQHLLNYYGKDADAGTPDFALAMYLDGSLRAWAIGLRPRENFFGRNFKDGRQSLPLVEVDPNPANHAARPATQHNVDGTCCSNKPLPGGTVEERQAIVEQWESEGGRA